MLAMDVWCFSKSTIRVDLEKHQTRLHYWGNSLCNFEEAPLQFWVFLLCTKHKNLPYTVYRVLFREKYLKKTDYPYVYVDGVYLKRSWGGEIQNVSVLVAIGVSQDGCREILGAAEGMKEDRESWRSFFVWLKERGLTGVRLIIGDKNLGMLETIPEVFPDARYQRCTVHFYRNIFSVTPRNKMKTVALMLKAIHAQESKEAAREKAIQVAEKLRAMKLAKAAKKVEDGIEETLTYMDFPTQHWTRIRTNNAIERLNREIKRRTKAIGAFPDGQSALMLVCARLRHVAATIWGARRYMNMDHLFKSEEDLLSDIIAG